MDSEAGIPVKTLFHFFEGHLEVVALLINHGAEVTCKDKKGYTPLHAAASNGQINVVKHLLNLGVEVCGNVLLMTSIFGDTIFLFLMDAATSAEFLKKIVPVFWTMKSTWCYV